MKPADNENKNGMFLLTHTRKTRRSISSVCFLYDVKTTNELILIKNFF